MLRGHNVYLAVFIRLRSDRTGTACNWFAVHLFDFHLPSFQPWRHGNRLLSVQQGKGDDYKGHASFGIIKDTHLLERKEPESGMLILGESCGFH
jgi:hypothetical protein